MDTEELKEAFHGLQRRAAGFMPSQVLTTAVNRDLFNRLGEEGRPLDRVRHPEEDPEALRRLCEVLVRLDLLEKRDRRFRCTPLSRAFLVDSAQLDVRPLIQLYDRLRAVWSHLDRAVLEGQSMQLFDDPEEFYDETFTEAMEVRAAFSREEVGRRLGEELGAGRLMDLGGGSGVYGRSYAKETPEARCVIADYPAVLEVARRYIRSEGLGDRVRTQPLDLLGDDDYGDGFDAVLLGYVLRLFGPEANRRILNRTARSLKPGGKVVILDLFDWDDPTVDRQARFFDVMMLLVSEAGQLYSRPMYGTWLEEAGFRDVRIRSLSQHHDLLVAERA